jgi:hypothetical protein
MSRTLELPDSVYEALLDAARARGMAPADWIKERLPRSEEPAAPAPMEDREAALERLLRQTVSLGHPTGADNELIDADLAGAYADAHQATCGQGLI